MNARSAQIIPPKMLEAFAERARNGEGVEVVDDLVQFPQGGNVISVEGFHGPCPNGTVVKDAARAEKLREILAGQSQ